MEYYVLCVGGKPSRVFTDKVAGLSALTEGHKLSDREKRATQKALEHGIPVGEAILVVGYERGMGWVKDRSLTRVS